MRHEIVDIITQHNIFMFWLEKKYFNILTKLTFDSKMEFSSPE